MSDTNRQWAICPIDCCEYAEEYDPSSAHFCPDCGIELISECPDCQSLVTTENQAGCSQCGQSLKS